MLIPSEFENNRTLSEMAYEAEGMTVQSENFTQSGSGMENFTPFRIENFTYKNEIVMETMFKHLEETDFLGVSVMESGRKGGGEKEKRRRGRERE